MERAQGVLIAGRYRLVRKLGAGGMGAVWLAQDISLDSLCALKLIDDDKAQSDEVRVRFEREAKAAAQLRGAHVVDVFDHGESDGTLFIAMEYLDGEDLGARLDRVGRLDPQTTYRIVAHVARALVRAHAIGIVHRDLKPENIFLVQGDEEEIAKVLDFGIAKHDAYSLQGKATRTGSFLGTPFYVSPEQARGKSTDYRSDLWSLGIIAFQCLTGRPPFESEALGELMGLILYEDVPSMTLKNPDLPPAIDAWWERAAARDREQRFQSAKELADALGHALGVRKSVAVPTIAPRRHDATGSFAAIAAPVLDASGALAISAAPDAVLPSYSDPEWVEERVETDAPVSRTRRSSGPFILSYVRLSWIRRRFRNLFAKHHGSSAVESLRAQPKRNLVVLGVSAGVLLGIVLTLSIVGSEAGQVSTTTDTKARHVASPATAVPQRNEHAAVPAPTVPAQAPTTTAPAVPQVPATSAPSPVDEAPSASQRAPEPAPAASVRSESKRRKPASTVKRYAPPRGPDYGI